MLLYSQTRTRISRDVLQKEFKLCGIPVLEVTYQQWLEKFTAFADPKDVKSSDFMGLYYNDRTIEQFGFPRRFIVINKNMPNYEKLLVYWHEVGHHACVKAGCLCAKRGWVFRKTELHAELAALFISHSRGYRDLTFELLKETVQHLDNESLHFIRNASMMVKHPSFIEAKSEMEDEFTDWLAVRKNAHLKTRYENAIVDVATRTCRWTPSAFVRRFAEDASCRVKMGR